MDYEVLRDFKAAPDGFSVESYAAGSVRDFDGALAEYATKQGWIRRTGHVQNKAIVTDGSQTGTVEMKRKFKRAAT